MYIGIGRYEKKLIGRTLVIEQGNLSFGIDDDEKSDFFFLTLMKINLI